MSSVPLQIEPNATVAGSTRRWLFSAPVDLAVFGGSALLSLALLALGGYLGILHDETPTWTWIPCILLIDVAHVWATSFRVYFDRTEFARRPLLYTLTPILGFLIGLALYSEGKLVFWRTLAYLAVFHFVRQQYGWVALYRARVGEKGRLGFWIDTLAIYLATLYPLLYWHAHLPRQFEWFIQKDFAGVPETVASVVGPIYWSVLALYFMRAGYLWLVAGTPNPGKDLVVLTTAICWHIGIITFNSDYAFTVTNVIIHGVPYLALIYWYRYRTTLARAETPAPSAGHLPRLAAILATVWLLAFVEEMFWNRSIWHEHLIVFGPAWDVAGFEYLIVPLLAVPQMTHYLLDGFIWKRKSNPELAVLW
uniref:Putative transmembrane protein n=1 Tax=uncultured Acidobacteria bacterium A2 TaxID=1036852 RepID=F8TTE8_9BACT|nr:putative transmembrane protein [uncultured Acidobacteria bacterium A2]